MRTSYGNYFLFQLSLPQFSNILKIWDKLFNENLNIQWNLLKKVSKKSIIETGIWSTHHLSAIMKLY